MTGSAQPFKILEPIDDAVERLASAIFLVGTVAGIMTVVLPILGGVALVMIGSSFAVLAGLHLTGLRFPGQHFVSTLLQDVARLGGLGFLVVVAFSISSWFADGISNRAWGEYERTIARIAEEMPNLSRGDASTIDEDFALEPEREEELIEPESIETGTEERGVFGKAVDALKATGEGALDIASAAKSGVNDMAGSAVDGVKGMAASTREAYNKAADIVRVLSSQSDDLVRALMGVFAAFLFKTVVFPVLVLLGLWKLVGNFEFMRRSGPPELTTNPQ